MKTETPAEVRIYTMAGEMVSELNGGPGPEGLHIYTWPGTDVSGSAVVPGIYLCRVKIDSQANGETLARVVNVAY